MNPETVRLALVVAFYGLPFLLLFVAVWALVAAHKYMARGREHLETAEKHMETVEQLLQQIADNTSK